jgi:hypothetical protein
VSGLEQCVLHALARLRSYGVVPSAGAEVSDRRVPAVQFTARLRHVRGSGASAPFAQNVTTSGTRSDRQSGPPGVSMTTDIEYLGEPRSRFGPRLFTNEHRVFHDPCTLKRFAFLSPDIPLTAFR